MATAAASESRKKKPSRSALARRSDRDQSANKKNGGSVASIKGAAKKSSKVRKTSLTDELLVQAYRDVLRSRLTDDKTIVLYKQNKCHFQIGCAGHETVGVACALAFRPGKDWFYPYYRDMALCAGLGMTSRDFMLNAMNKQDDPNSHGRQMPMHYGHKGLRIVNQSSPTGTQFLQAVGAALGIKRQGLDEVVYVSSGEGTCSQGDYHEALNWAAREKLPVIFVIQNNNFAISVPISEQLAGKSVYKLAAGYEGLERREVDGTDFVAMFEAVAEAHARAQNGEGPTMIEAHVPRLQSHSISDNHLKYRTPKDIEKEQERDPLPRLAALLLKKKLLKQSHLDQIYAEVKSEIDTAAEWAETQADPDPTRIMDHVYVNPNPGEGVTEGVATGPETYIVDAINHALHEEMERDPKMYVFGQDIAHGKGGVFTVTSGLTAKFGVDRAFNAPLAEASIAGVAVGMSTIGLKPVAEIQFGDYVWTAMMQIRNELAMMNYRSAGDFTCPAVIRIAVGGYIRGACYHSQNIEATFAHFPGLQVLYPSNATDAKGLLKSAIRGQDPVLFLEHKGLYRQVYAKGAEGDKDFLTPIGKAKVVREGQDLTIVTWGALVYKSTWAAAQLEKEGYSVEVIDLRTIAPFDAETVFNSVRKTGRVLIAHEDVEFGGFGGEIAAQIGDICFTSLDAPIKRVGMKNVAAVSHSGVMEEQILPQNDGVLAAAKAVLSF